MVVDDALGASGREPRRHRARGGEEDAETGTGVASLSGGRLASDKDAAPAAPPALAPSQRGLDDWPAPPGRAAFSGLAGDITATIEPHTESDPVALLVQLLVVFGSAIGRGAHFTVEATAHHTNEFVVLVGPSAKARKGSSFDHVERLFTQIDPVFTGTRLVSGLSSGEGLIWALRDEEGSATSSASGESDPADKRLLVVEPEFAAVLKQLAREGNTLSPVLRSAWDGKPLQVLTKNSPVRASGTHVSIVAHVTADELVRQLTSTEAANGFANRFLVICVRRSKLLPEGGSIDALDWRPLTSRLAAAVATARRAGRLSFDDQARSAWWEAYLALSEEVPGILGAISARAEAHVVRLSLLYALLDGAAEIKLAHLEAALSLWSYAAASARYVFGSSLGDALADDIHRALSQEPTGLTRSEIRDLFNRNRSSRAISEALARLARAGYASMERRQHRGRPTEIWHAISS
ncbi:MAG TPA: hypothetical protein VMD59_22670 [Acidimicrobiales bacterium]|nr:hypothetical protein [Acidimicrobiales bacterium]